MRGTANTSTGGQYCGRAVHGVSNLSGEELRQIEAHRAKARPTPWAHLALRYGVNEIDLRSLFAAGNDNTATVPPPMIAMPLTAEQMLPGLWGTGLSVKQISGIIGMDDRSVQRMRVRLGLAPRVGDDGRRGRPPAHPDARA